RPADLRRFADREWIRHFVPQHYDRDWSVLPLRSKANATHPIQMIYSDPTCDTYVDTPLLAWCPSMATALTGFACPLLSVRLMRLGAGSIIKTHRDAGRRARPRPPARANRDERWCRLPPERRARHAPRRRVLVPASQRSALGHERR